MLKNKILPLLLLTATIEAKAQDTFKGLEHLFTQPANYVVQYTNKPLKVDGVLNEEDWAKAQWTSDFVDIEGKLKPLPSLSTKVKMLWSDSTLYIAAKIEEPQVWATQTHHDDIIFKDNDFEIFINPENNTHHYFEIEVNSINKIFDLFLPKPYRNNGDALVTWDAEDLQSAVKIDGTINNTSDKDKGWTVEMAIPFKALRMGFTMPVAQEGSIWRINFSRVEWDTKVVDGKNVKLKDANGKNLPEHNWVWSPQGVINMHYPERWGYLKFTKLKGTSFELPYEEAQKQYLWLIYYKQKEFLRKTGKYAESLEALGIPITENIKGERNQLQMQATNYQFTASISINGKAPIFINDEGLIKDITSKQ